MDNPPPPPYTPYDPNPNPSPTPLTAITSTAEASKNNGAVARHSSSEDASIISGTSYHAMRPPPTWQGRKPFQRNILVQFEPDRNEVSVPWPMHSVERDIGEEDWQAFINHMTPSMPAIGLEPPRESENSRAAYIGKVIEEWNEAFFFPRNISVLLKSTSRLMPGSKPSFCARPRMTSKKFQDQLNTALHEAVKTQDEPTARLLLSRGANPNYRPTCTSPMILLAMKHAGTSKANIDLVKLLLSYGHNIEAQAPSSMTALYYAVKHVDIPLIELLLAHGAKIDNAHPTGDEPTVYRAVAKNQTKIIEILLAEKPNLEVKPLGGTTPLYHAAKEENIPLVRLLLSHGAKADCCEAGGGQSAMLRAAKSGNTMLVRLLLDYGADVNSAPMGSKTALAEAMKRGDEEMVNLLIERGADAGKSRWGEKSATVVAAQEGKMGILKKMLS